MHACLTSIGGDVLEESVFSKNATVSDLIAMIKKRKPRWTTAALHADDGKRIDDTERLESPDKEPETHKKNLQLQQNRQTEYGKATDRTNT